MLEWRQLGRAPAIELPRHFAGQRDEAAAYEYLLANRRHLDADAALELARLARRREEWTLALEIWNELTGSGNVEATERLAKYYEHHAQDVPRALQLTERLLQLGPGSQEHRHRERRLLRKLAPNTRYTELKLD